MHKFDPVDIFPEAQERGRDKNKRDRKPAPDPQLASSAAAAPGSATEPATERRGRSRRKKSSASSGGGGTTPSAIAQATPQPTPSAAPSANTTPLTQPSPTATMAASANRGVSSLAAAANAPPQMMEPNASLNSSSPASDQNGSEPPLSLPVILGLFAIVSLALIALVLALMKQLRKS